MRFARERDRIPPLYFLESMRTLLSLLLATQLIIAPLAQSPPAIRASARAEQMQQALQERTKSPIKNLDIDLIMLGADFAGTAPSEVSWA